MGLVFVEGTLEVLKNGKVVGQMTPGRAFGELAILYGCTRTASIRGESVNLLGIPKLILEWWKLGISCEELALTVKVSPIPWV